jgi:DNA-binding winged helix-turn-helix (wHTH) protein
LLVAGQPAPLGARAFDLLLALVERRDRTVTKNELLDLVWPGLVVEENNLQVQISTLRKVLGQDAIATIPGQGYRFTLAPAGAVASSLLPLAAANNSQSHPAVEASVPALPRPHLHSLPPGEGRACGG